MVTITVMFLNSLTNIQPMKVLLSSLLITIAGGVISSLLGGTVSTTNFGLLTLLVIAFLINEVFNVSSSVPFSSLKMPRKSHHVDVFLQFFTTAVVGGVVFHSTSQFGTPSMVEGAVWSVLTVPVFMLMLMNSARATIFQAKQTKMRFLQKKQQKRMDAHDVWLEKMSLKFDAWEFQYNRQKRQSSSE